MTEVESNRSARTRGYGYAAPLRRFVQADSDAVLGELQSAATRLTAGATEHQQVLAWQASVDALRSVALDLLSDGFGSDWHVCLEYQIPRRGGRIDAVLLAEDLIFVIEFKSSRADASAKRQVEDYGLELLDFHEASQVRRILPAVCAPNTDRTVGTLNGDWGVATVSSCTPEDLAALLRDLFGRFHEAPEERSAIDPLQWLHAPYAPTPTIIEAAQALYAGHQVRELSTSRASAEHLQRSFDAVAKVVRDTFERGGHTLCLLTGIPGAGKTLAGLNVVHNVSDQVTATFLSGNGPLVKVLQEVLATDLAVRSGTSKAEGRRQSKTLVTNVHRWLEEYVDRQPDRVPRENLVVFDEAQRAWSREHSLRKFKRDASEPEMMLSVLSRQPAAVLVALVGGGQEINTGEAGLSEWGRALVEKFPDWQVAIAPQVLNNDSSLPGSTLFDTRGPISPDRIQLLEGLHLAVSQRSFRAEALTEWVEAVLANRPDDAARLMEELGPYPIVVTRDLDRAREWLRSQTRGLRRCGLLAGSGARRLRPHGIAVQERIDEVDWFLRPPEDVRSSNFLELALSEFGVQGLEVDWSCVAWGGDLTRAGKDWESRRFRGSRWQSVRSDEARVYTINRYRVLLTRAREGVAIWIPPGEPRDPTRNPMRFDKVEAYLVTCGAKTL